MKFTVVGSHASNSLSPKLHNWIYKSLNLNHSYSYLEVNEITGEMINLYDGLNITNPFKNKVISYLNDMDPLANKTQSVNCIKVDNNKAIGYNTDYYGFSKLIEINKIDFSNKKIIVLGAGGASNTICSYLYNHNYNFKILNRNNENALSLINKIELNAHHVIKHSSLKNEEYDVIINCLSLNVDIVNYLKQIGHDFHLLDFYIDINYNLMDGMSSNINSDKLVDGMDMLIFQAIQSIEIWIENDISQNVDYNKLRNHIIGN